MLRLSWILLLAGVVWAQAPAPPAPPAPQQQSLIQEMVHREFGPEFSVVPQFSVLTADLDGDGTEDVVIVATGKKILVDQLDFHYKVIDPYNEFFGFGDPKVTSQFSINEGEPHILLVVHNWRAATPKAKYAVINLPFKTLSIGRELIKKKAMTTISAEETSGMTSFLYWSGKKYKWEAGKLD